MRNIIFIILNSLILNSGLTQNAETNPYLNREIRIKTGVSFIKNLENRFSTNKHRSLSPSFSFSYTKTKLESISELEIGFVTNKANRANKLDFKFIRPVVNYSYAKKIKNGFWLGGFFESNTLLNFPVTKSYLFNNNPIAYTIAQSIGPKVFFDHQINGLGNNPLIFAGSVQSSLLSYTIRPGFGHPYPEQFLRENVFTPTRKGIAGPLMRSGKIVLPNKYRSLKVKLGISYFLNDHIRVGMEYTFDNFLSQLDHLSTYQGQDIQLFVSYNY